MTLALIITAGVLAYGLAGGFTGAMLAHKFRKDCSDCGLHSSCGDHWAAMTLSGIFWPFALPALGGSMASALLTRAPDTQRMSRRERRRAAEHKRELEKIEAQKELAILETKKAESMTAYLEANGVNARVHELGAISLSK